MHLLHYSPPPLKKRNIRKFNLKYVALIVHKNHKKHVLTWLLLVMRNMFLPVSFLPMILEGGREGVIVHWMWRWDGVGVGVKRTAKNFWLRYQMTKWAEMTWKFQFLPPKLIWRGFEVTTCFWRLYKSCVSLRQIDPQRTIVKLVGSQNMIHWIWIKMDQKWMQKNRWPKF